MRRFPIAWLLAAGCMLVHAAPAADSSLYRAFGEKPGLSTLMDDFVARLKADPRVGSSFKDVKAEHLATQLTDQLCALSGGPCVYEGAPMREAHRELAIGRADFNAVVEVLQFSMDARGIAFRDQNRMLALLAPMHREIVTR